MKPTLLFVYNADSGLFNTLADIAHRIFSPQTYQCNLCAITYSAAGMKKDWKEFLNSLNFPMEFLHRDELKARYEVESVSLPAIFARRENELIVLLDAGAINSCKTLEDLQQLILNELAQSKQARRSLAFSE